MSKGRATIDYTPPIEIGEYATLGKIKETKEGAINLNKEDWVLFFVKWNPKFKEMAKWDQHLQCKRDQEKLKTC